MNAQERIRRGYMVSVRPVAETTDNYRLYYVPRGLMQVRGPGGNPKRVPEFKATAEVERDGIRVNWEKAPSDPEATREDFDEDVRARVRTLHNWMEVLTPLVTRVRAWAEELGWAARVVDKPLEEADIGDYKAPGLVLQRDMTRVGLEPIGRAAPGVEGVVDLYVLPAYDDIASLLFYGNRWHLHRTPPEIPSVADKRESTSQFLTKKAFREVLDDMMKNGG